MIKNKYLRFKGPEGHLTGEIEIRPQDNLKVRVGNRFNISDRNSRGLIDRVEDEILIPPYRSDTGLFSFPKAGTLLSQIKYSVPDGLVLTPLIEGIQYLQISGRPVVIRAFLGDKKHPPETLYVNKEFQIPISRGRNLNVINIFDCAGFILVDRPIIEDVTLKKDVRTYFRRLNLS